MRIRNSRTSFPMLPLPPESVSGSAHFRSRGSRFDGRFLVEEGLSESGSGQRTSNCSRTFQREEEKSGVFPNVVLALRATATRPERELPLKKRMYYRLKSEKMEEVKEEKAAVVEANMDATIMPEKEDSSELNSAQRSKSIQCVLNCESFIPCPMFDGLQGQERDEKLFFGGMPMEHEEKQKRRRGRPRKKGRFARGTSGSRKSKYVID